MLSDQNFQRALYINTKFQYLKADSDNTMLFLNCLCTDYPDQYSVFERHINVKLASPYEESHCTAVQAADIRCNQLYPVN